ncbi:MAG: tetratricopeptide repeat protein [Planctomycetes bacterium]|nr:tetratricopeptide repeat protein [Planctomycetota bacterium]
MKGPTIVLVAAGLVFSFLLGFIVGRSGREAMPEVGNPRAVNPGSAFSAPTPSPAMSAGPSPAEQRIVELEARVAAQPDDRAAWVELGHRYFDADRPDKSIAAYDRALALNADDADVLTDQGVMYRRQQQFTKAIDNFQRARTVDANHRQSLYNIGVVYRFDLGQPEKAREAWTEYVLQYPDDPRVPEIQQALSTPGQ